MQEEKSVLCGEDIFILRSGVHTFGESSETLHFFGFPRTCPTSNPIERTMMRMGLVSTLLT